MIFLSFQDLKKSSEFNLCIGDRDPLHNEFEPVSWPVVSPVLMKFSKTDNQSNEKVT